MSVKIQVPELKGYKAIKNPTLTPLIDSTINSKWWNSDGWSTMYDARYQELYDLLKSGDFLKNAYLGSELNTDPFGFDEDISEENQERLKQVFDFLEKKERKPNPTVDKSNDPEFDLFKKKNTIIVGKKGFRVASRADRGAQTYPYPCDGVIDEYLGEQYSIVEDILDDGVFVLKSIDDMLEVYKSKDIPILQDLKNRMYII
tara:strand:- start:477 stop:1082 length:606 start_codon:yes stop_codon:yes gene_type:complete